MKLIADKPIKEQFKVWHHIMEKPYDINTMYAVERFKIFESNHRYVTEVNKQNKGYELGLGTYADLSNEEYSKMILTLKDDDRTDKDKSDDDDIPFDRYKNPYVVNKFLDFDSYVDNKNYLKDEVKDTVKVTTDWSSHFPIVENQEQCGSCWAFATTSILEAAIYAYKVKNSTDECKKIEPVKLSKQQVVDCDDNSFGCNGGYTYYAITRYMSGNDVNHIYDYGKYSASQNTCKIVSPKKTDGEDHSTYKVKSFKYNVNKCENGELKYDPVDFIKDGPAVISINASSRTFQLYASGILDLSEECLSQTRTNHAMVMVQVDKEKGFYKIRNSWGTTWGEDGYAKILIDDCKKSSTYMSCFVSKYFNQITAIEPTI